MRTKQSYDEVRLAHQVALHALHEYRLWRSNSYVGNHLADARPAYIAILRKRTVDALCAYKLVRDSSLTRFRQAA